MKISRRNLDKELREILGSNNVYFEPPESVRMKYPAIRYELTGESVTKANNKRYAVHKKFKITVISSDPTNEIIDAVLQHFPLSSFDRRYESDDLVHDVAIIEYLNEEET